MISSIKIYKPTKSVILIKSIIYKVNKASSIVIRGTAHFSFLKNTKPTKHIKIHTKNKAISIVLVNFAYFHLLLVT